MLDWPFTIPWHNFGWWNNNFVSMFYGWAHYLQDINNTCHEEATWLVMTWQTSGTALSPAKYRIKRISKWIFSDYSMLFITKCNFVSSYTLSFATTGYNFYTVPLYHRVLKNSPVGTFLLLQRAWTMRHLNSTKTWEMAAQSLHWFRSKSLFHGHILILYHCTSWLLIHVGHTCAVPGYRVGNPDPYRV
jgi:hypothetical protein